MKRGDDEQQVLTLSLHNVLFSRTLPFHTTFYQNLKHARTHTEDLYVEDTALTTNDVWTTAKRHHNTKYD